MTQEKPVSRPFDLSHSKILWALVLTFIALIIAAISTPNLLRSRMAADRARSARNSEPQAAAQNLPGFGKVVKSATLALVVGDPIVSAKAVEAFTNRFGGYVENGTSQTFLDDENRKRSYATVNIRVPAAKFEELRREVLGAADQVERDEIEAKDVTGAHTDLAATVRAIKAEEAQYLRLMERAGSIKDTLQVAERLADARSRIERTEAQHVLLSQQIEMASLHIELKGPAAAKEVGWNALDQSKAAFRDASEDFASYGDFLIVTLMRTPVILLWILTVLGMLAIALRAFRWVKGFLVRMAVGGEPAKDLV